MLICAIFPETLGNKLCASWELELEKTKGKPNLLRALLRVFGWYFALLGLVLFLLELGLRTLQPIFLLKLIAYYTHGSESIESAYYYAAGVILCSALNVIIMHPYMLGTMHVGESSVLLLKSHIMLYISQIQPK